MSNQQEEESWEEPIGAQSARAELRAIYATPDTTGTMLRRAYNSGYMAGHHDTVEAVFSDLHHSEMDEAHSDEVAELFGEDAQ